MARRRVPRIYEVELESLTVRMRSIRFGKVRELMRFLDSDGETDEVMEKLAENLLENIVSWDLVDEDGSEMPVNRESLDELEYGEVIELTSKWLDLITGPDKELGKDSSSGVTFPVALPTMEAL